MRKYEEMKKLKEQGFTHQQIADACGVSKAYVGQVIAEYDPKQFQPFSKRRCKYVHLRKWLNENQVSISELLRRTGRVPYAVTAIRMRDRLCGKTKWSEREIEKVCEVTGLTMMQLLKEG